MQYAEDHNWDSLTTQDLIDSTKSVADTVQQFVYDQTGWGSPPAKPSETSQNTVRTANKAVSFSKDRIIHATERLKTTVKMAEQPVSAIVRHQSAQLSDGVRELVEEAEAALAGKPRPSKTQKPTSTPELTLSVEPTAEAKDVSSPTEVPNNVYDAPLPLGFEPPPGFSKPKPPPPPAPEVVEAPPAPPPLPLIAPEISEHAASEPIISQLATTIDNLTVFLNSNPAAAEKAHAVIDTAKLDLMNLASRIDKIKQDEHTALEQHLDDQAREYTVKLLELEMTAQDKLDSQEDEFRKLFEEEKARLVKAYREKLSRELQTQSEIINERYATLI